MSEPGKHSRTGDFILLGIGLLIPSLVIFYLETVVGHIAPFPALADIIERQFASGHNLFMLAVFGLIPFVALNSVCKAASGRFAPARVACLRIGGLAGIVGLMIPTHVLVWYPLYGGGHMSSTAVVAFVFIPFYCLPTMAIGILLGWLVSLLPVFKVPH